MLFNRKRLLALGAASLTTSIAAKAFASATAGPSAPLPKPTIPPDILALFKQLEADLTSGKTSINDVFKRLEDIANRLNRSPVSSPEPDKQALLELQKASARLDESFAIVTQIKKKYVDSCAEIIQHMR